MEWLRYAALVGLIQRECNALMIVDPYLNSDIFTHFLPHTVTQAGVRCLTTRQSKDHPGLLAAEEKWSSDALGTAKNVEIRYSRAGALHDRLIIIDGREVWLISQSFKDIAKRSPASVSRAGRELGEMKAQHYNVLWNQSTPIA